MNPFARKPHNSSFQTPGGNFSPDVSSISHIQPTELEMSDEHIRLGGHSSYQHQPSGFHENYANQASYPAHNYDDANAEDSESELTLLQELDIDLAAVKTKLLSAFLFHKPSLIFVTDSDMTGPFILGTIIGALMALVS